MMDALVHNLRYATRALLKTPGFTAVAVATLALGIGANSSVFTLVNAALFRPVAAPRHEELVWLAATNEPGDRAGLSFQRTLAYPEFKDYEAQVTSVTLTAYQDIPLALGSGGEPERVTGLIVSGSYFNVLGFRPVAGRFFSPEDDVRGATPVVVITHTLWQRRFDGASDLIGRDITINGRPFTVIGIAPPGFVGTELGSPVEMWVTFATAKIAMPDGETLVDDRRAHWLRSFGRLKPGTTIAQADAQARAVGARLAAEMPEFHEGQSARITPLAGGLDPGNRSEALPIMLLLMAVPFLVLLIACANVANLMLARAAARRREIAIRLSMGATRWRLLSQLLTEAMLLTLVAAAAGLLLSYWLNDLLMAVSNLPPDIAIALTPDRRVVGFTAVVATATGLFFGLLPAIGATRPDLVPALKDEGGGLGRQVRRSRLVSSFVVAQVALSLVLLVTAGLFLRSLGKALRVDPGLDTSHAIALSFDLRIQGYDREQQGVFYSRLLERVHGLPGVTAVSLSSPMPLGNRLISTPVAAEGPNDDDVNVQVSYAAIWPGYFDAIGSPLVRGRDFTTHDVDGSPLVAIINETLARRLWPDQEAIGKRLRFPGRPKRYVEVVGVARNGKYHELTEAPRGFIYVPERQRADLSDITLLVRTSGNPRVLIPELGQAIHTLDRNLPLFQVVTLEDALRARLDKEMGASSVLGVFGGLALLLAALGLYGVMAYAVAQRTREVGVRMALGAAQVQVLRQFVGEGVRLAGVGIVIGVLLAAALTRVIQRFLYGITPTDALTFALCAGLLGAVAAMASLIPARRAAKVDPMVALRYD
jgi:predicted permease